MGKSKKEKKTSGKDGGGRKNTSSASSSLSSSRERKLQRVRTFGHVIFQIILMTIVFVQVNYLSCRRYQTWDLTQNRKFTLSETTSRTLAGFGENVEIVMVYLANSELYSDVKGLVSEYDRVGGDRVSAEYLDLSRSRGRLAEMKDRYKLQFSHEQVVIFGESGRIKTISAEEMVTRDPSTGRVLQFRGEEVLTSALLEVTEQQQRKIYLITGGRRADELVRMASQLQPLANAQNARLESLVLEGLQTIPDDADALFFPGNTTDLSARELKLVRSFWEDRKGGLVIFLDPGADTPNLNSLLREHGVAPNGDRVLTVMSIPGVAARRSYDVPVALIPGKGPTRDLPALSMRLSGQTQSLKVLEGDDLLVSENIHPRALMLAGDGFWGESDFNAEDISFNPDEDTGRPDPVYTAASVEKGDIGDVNLEHRTSRLVVAGNANLISPDGSTTKVAADFTMAAMNWVMNREEMIGISPRKPTAFTLNINDADFGLLQSLMTFFLPLLAIIAGLIVWMRRRA